MTMVAVKLTDNEWRVKCEELAEMELRRKKRRESLEEEASEWSERKKDLQSKIDNLTDRIEKLALEVSTRETMRDAQTELPLQEAEPMEPLTPPEASSETSSEEPLPNPEPEPPSEETPAAPEPGSEG